MTNTTPIPSSETHQPSPTTASSEALLIAVQAWVLRLLADPKSKPGQVLNALRRLERLKEFPHRVEKQARTLALAEARVDLRQRALSLREALLQERREKREIAAAKAAAKAAKTAAKPQPSAVSQGAVNAPVTVAAAIQPLQKPTVKAPIPSSNPVVLQTGIISQKDWAHMPLTHKAFGPILDQPLRKAV